MIKLNIQFRYIIQYAHFHCSKCDENIELETNNELELKDVDYGDLTYKCKCGTIYKIPSHYIDTYHNKTLKVSDGNDK